MENLRVEVAQATAVVGYDLLTGLRDARTPEPRQLVGLGFVGSAVIGDCIGELYINRVLTGTYACSTAAVKGMDTNKDILQLDSYVPANAQIEFKLVKAAVTNPVVLQLEFAKAGYGGRSGGFRRRSRRTSPARGGGFARRAAGGMY